MRFLLIAVLSAAPLLAQEPERIVALVRQLGAEEFEQREAAARELVKIGAPAYEAVRAAASSEDAEVAARAREILPYVRWSLALDCPTWVLALFEQYEATTGAERAKALQEIVRADLPETRRFLEEAWSTTMDAETLLALAPGRIRFDTGSAEARLREAARDNDPRILRLLGDALRFRGDVDGAAEAYGRALAAGETDQGVTDAHARMLLLDGRYDELAKADLPPGSASSLAQADALFRLDRAKEAEERLVRMSARSGGPPPPGSRNAEDLALRYGATSEVLQALGLRGHPGAEAACALARGGDVEGALAEACRITDPRQRGAAFHGALEAAGRGDLLSGAFLAELTSPTEGAAGRHRGLASRIEHDAPEAAAREREKADILEGKLPEARGGPRGRGIFAREAPVRDPDTLFAWSPVKIGDAWYCPNRRGEILKLRHPLDPSPIWVSRPFPARRFAQQGWTVTEYASPWEFGRFDGRIVALVPLHAGLVDSNGGVGEWCEGMLLCLLDEATGHVEWSRRFPAITDALVSVEQGILVMVGEGVSVYDLRTRDWRWSVGDAHLGQVHAQAFGDGVYLGYPCGILCKLRASDGALVWRREWPGAFGSVCALAVAETSLLFQPGGARLVCVSSDDGASRWEADLPYPGWSYSLLPDGERVFVATYASSDIAAFSIRDGSLLWKRRHFWPAASLDWTLAGRFLAGVSASIVLLDKEDGSVEGTMSGEFGGLSRCPMFADGDRLFFASTSTRGMTSSSDVPPDESVQLYEVDVRLDAAKAPAVPTDADDPLERVWLLDDACALGAPREAAPWLALAEAAFDAKRPDLGVDALRTAILFQEPSLESVRAWLGRLVAAETGSEEKGWSFGSITYDLKRLARSLEVHERLDRGDLTLLRHEDGDPSSYEIVDEAIASSPAETMRRAVAFLRVGAWPCLPLVVGGLARAEDPTALEAIGVLLSSGADARSWRLWSLQEEDSHAVRDALKTRAQKGDSAVRGAALAALVLMGEEPEAKEDLLAAAFGSSDPCVRIAAAGVLARSGDSKATEAILAGLGSKSDDERTLAIWVAGASKVLEAVPALLQVQGNDERTAIRALGAIGGAEAETALLERASAKDPPSPWDPAPALASLGTARAMQALTDRCRDRKQSRRAGVAFETLLEVDSPAARQGVIDFASDRLAALPEDQQTRLGFCRALLGEGRIAEAEAQIATLRASCPPAATDPLLADLLAAKGDDEGARAARERAAATAALAKAIRQGGR